jgi:hypothetical protein
VITHVTRLLHSAGPLTGVARDGHDGVDARRQLPELEVLHGPRGDQRLLGVVQHKALHEKKRVQGGQVSSGTGRPAMTAQEGSRQQAGQQQSWRTAVQLAIFTPASAQCEHCSGKLWCKLRSNVRACQPCPAPTCVSMRSWQLVAYMPMACLPMADWYVLRGDWLWSGKGMMEAHTPCK